MRVLFSPFIPWNDITFVCRETHLPDVWDIRTYILEIRNPILKKEKTNLTNHERNEEVKISDKNYI